MILLLVVLAMADCDLDTSVASVREGGKRQAYDCLIRADEGGSRLVRGLYETPADARLSRALALWMLQRADSPFDPLHAAQLVPADLRLLADGARARRGRKSPVPEHDSVFNQFDWYKPVATYTDGRLRPGDREQIALLDRPLPASRVLAATEPPPAGASWISALSGADGSGLAQTAVPVALLVLGLAGAGWYLRRPSP
jgi:hypothetical protein